jgi:PIN domain nuclease of toxin-antitoxin system
MKKYLLDTHYLIWIMKNPDKLKKEIVNIVENTQNTIYVSQVSLWEIAIKQKIGKLEILDELENFKIDIENNGFVWLKIKDKHIFETLEIPLFENHRDPFDRLLIAQAKIENLTLISDDTKFDLYPEIQRIW